jgi:hypothetical protein
MKTNLTAMTKMQNAKFYGIHRKTLVSRCKKSWIFLGQGLIMPKTILMISD